MTSQLKKIALGTGSAIKIQALEEAFPNAEILAVVDALSGVPAQPIGVAQTRQGALNRARAAKIARPDAEAFVGIENGMWERAGKPGTWEDAAVIVMLIKKRSAISSTVSSSTTATSSSSSTTTNANNNNNNNAADEGDDTHYLEVISDAIEIPKKEELPFSQGRNGEWSELKDPHAVLTKGERTRKDFIVHALQKLKL